MREVLFLQCRLDSSRLPGKALLPLKGLTVIERVMEALSLVQVSRHVLLTTDDSKKALKPLARNCGFDLFSGPKNDVLLRFLMAARHYGADTIVRATGDNPLVSPALANSILQEHRTNVADYSGYTGIPLGTGVEVLSCKALEEAHQRSDSKYDREHVSPYLYNHPEVFHLHRRDISHRYGSGSVKISLDTEEDYKRIMKIYEELHKGEVIEIEALLHYIKKEGLQ